MIWIIRIIRIIDQLITKESLKDVKMFISTALSHTNIQGNYSKIVKKIFSKPIEKNSIKEIIESL